MYIYVNMCHVVQVLVASLRVIKHMSAEKERRRAEEMLKVCGDLIDLDISILSIKINKHVRNRRT